MRRVAVVILTLAFALVLASTAQARSPLTGESVADAATEAASVSTTEELIGDFCPQTDRGDDGGRRHTVTKNIKNVFGTVLAKYVQVVKWCYTGVPWAPYAGGKITWIDRDRRGTVLALAWEFVGHIDTWGYGGKGDKVALRGTQGKFRLCPSICVQTKTPWIQHNVWGTGQYEWSSGW
jgi:hypothetical protein